VLATDYFPVLVEISIGDVEEENSLCTTEELVRYTAKITV
jgi:hypothetical protein